MAEVKTLDVRTMIPIKRHETLLRMFEELPPAESFIFTNDHDPKPLYYEMRSIFGDVIDWEYLARDAKEWTVKVTRTEASGRREFDGISTLIDLRKTEGEDWKHTIFHRYGMMQPGDVMEILAAQPPTEIQAIFTSKFEGKHTWTYEKEGPDEYVVHVEKLGDAAKQAAAKVTVVREFDVRPHPPALRHDMVFDAFDDLKGGEAFVFTNDHDPKPLYYQIEAESKAKFDWEYLEDGPEEWKVKVTKFSAS